MKAFQHIILCMVYEIKVLLTMASLLLDIDGDGIINRKDMDSVLDLMTDNTMDDELKNHIIDGVGCAC